MEDMENKVSEGGEAALKPSFKQKVENFWYHYKWHTIAAIFAIIVLTVCTLQMCRKTSYDVHITYAGYYEIERVGSGGSSPYSEAVTSFSRLCEDFDGDGEINISLQTLFVVSDEEREMLIGNDGKLEINEALVKEDTDTLKSELIYGDQYVFFVSESIFREYEAAYEGTLFLPLGEYATENDDFVFASENKTGVYLNSLEISRLPILSDMPEDTIVCMRALSEVSQVFGKAQNEENYRRGIEVIKNIFEFK